MAPVRTYYQQQVQKWLAQHPGHCVTIYQVAKLFGSTFLQAAIIDLNNPINCDVYPEHLFAPSERTEITMKDPNSISDIQCS